MAKKLEIPAQMSSTTHLIINPFGPARLFLYGSVVLDTGMPTNIPTGRDLNYLFRCNPNETFDIQYRTDSSFNIAVYLGENWVSTITIRGKRMSFDGIYEVTGSTVTHHFNVDPHVAPPSSTMKLVIRNLAVVSRIDFRVANSSWFAAVIMHGQLVTVRPNGNWFFDQVIRYTRTVAFNSQNLDRPFQPIFQDKIMTGRLGVWPRGGYVFSQLTETRGNPSASQTSDNVPQNIIHSDASSSQTANEPAQVENDPSDSSSDVSITTVKPVELGPVMRCSAEEWNSPGANDRIEEPLRLIDECAPGDEDLFEDDAKVERKASEFRDMPRLISTLKVPMYGKKTGSSKEYKMKMAQELAEMMVKMFDEHNRKTRERRAEDDSESEEK